MRERERDLLNGRRTGFADVIAADRNRVPVGQLTLAEREDVGDQAQRMAWRIDIGAARHVFLQDIVLNRAGQFLQRHALAFRDRDVERQQHDRRRIDRHRRRDVAERNAVEERVHVFDRIDRHTDATNLAGGQRMVRVVPHLCRQIEGDAQAADALRQQVAIAAIGFLRRREPVVLPHRPEPASVHRWLDAASEGKLAWLR